MVATRFSFALGFLLVAFNGQMAIGGQITPSDFSAAAISQDFQGLGGSTIPHATPFAVGGDVYITDNNNLISSGKFGPMIGRAGTAVGNDPEGSNAAIGFIEIELASPAYRAGLYVGFEFAWSADVQFYDSVDQFIGSIALSGVGKDSGFAGWKADGAWIGRIRVVDSINNSRRIIIDDLIQEVPEPSSLCCLLFGLLAHHFFASNSKLL